MFKYIIVIPVPVLLLVSGLISLNKPPKNINSFYGYRTARSMRDSRSWDRAQKMMSAYFIYYSVAVLVLGIILSVVCRIFFDRDYIPCMIMLFQAFGIFTVIAKIESNLKKEHKHRNKK